MDNMIYFLAKIHFTRPAKPTSFFSRLKNEKDYCHFAHLVLAKDIQEAREKAKAYAVNFFKGIKNGEFTYVDVPDTII